MSGNQNGQDGRPVAGLMKVFEIQRVVPHLIDVIALELRFSNFEFHHKDDWT